MNDDATGSRPRAHDHRRPRVLRVITRLAVSGVSTHVTLANQALTRRGWDTLLVHGRVQPDELEIDLPIKDVATRYIDTLARPIDPIADLRTAASLLSVIRSFRPDIIHTHHSKAGLIGRSVGILAGVPRIHTFHGHVFEGYFGARTSAAIVATERLLATRTSRLIALGPLQRDDLLARGIGRPDRFEIVPLGLDLDRYRRADRVSARRELGLPGDAVIIVSVGRIVPIKRVDRLIRAFASVHAQCPDARLFVIGDGSERAAAEQQVADAGLGAAVTFTGWRSDTATWYGAADFLALSSITRALRSRSSRARRRVVRRSRRTSAASPTWSLTVSRVCSRRSTMSKRSPTRWSASRAMRTCGREWAPPRRRSPMDLASIAWLTTSSGSTARCSA